MYLIRASIVTAFSRSTIGTKILDPEAFMWIVTEAIASHDTGKDRAPGQHFIMLPDTVLATISAGVGNRTTNPDDYVVREHRGVVSAYLKREKAAKANGCAAVVYTREAYLVDPDVIKDPKASEEIASSNATHVLVAVLGFAGPKAPLSPQRFVANLAGGNNEALMWSADEIRERAREIAAYDQEWAVVAD